ASSEDLVRRLNRALNRGLSADLNEISREPEGRARTVYRPPGKRIGFVDAASGRVAIDLLRAEQKNEPAIWLFSAETLRNIPAMSDSAEPGFTHFLPKQLIDIEFLSIPLWRWLAGILAIPLGLGLSSLIT